MIYRFTQPANFIRQIRNVLFLSLLSPTVFGEISAINWATIESSPLFISSGKFAHQGICDSLVNELIKAMPGTKHTLTPLPNLRLKKKMDDNEKLCYPCFIHRTIPLRNVLLSSPTTVYLPHVLIMLEKNRDSFIQDFGNLVSLETLIQSRKYMMGHQSGRKFSPSLQNILDSHIGRDMEIPSEVGSTTSLMKQVDLERVDFIIDYPIMLSFYNKTSQRPFSWLPIQENSGQVVLGAVGCSGPKDDNFKYDAIRKINAILPKILASQSYQNAINKWFVKFDPDYLNKYRKHLLNGDTRQNKLRNNNSYQEKTADIKKEK